MGIGVTAGINGTIIANFNIMFGGIIWRYMMTSESDFWYYHTKNTDIAAILDREPFWTYLSSNLGITVSNNDFNSYLHSHTCHLNLDRNDIIIGMEIMECCHDFLCDLSIDVQSIAGSVTVFTFPPLAILYLLLTFWSVLDNF